MKAASASDYRQLAKRRLPPFLFEYIDGGSYDEMTLAGERITVLADGRVRFGLDVVRTPSLGAHGVLLGRAWAYALAGGGGRGVAHLLQLIEAEMRVAMALTGVLKVQDLGRHNLVRGRAG